MLFVLCFALILTVAASSIISWLFIMCRMHQFGRRLWRRNRHYPICILNE